MSFVGIICEENSQKWIKNKIESKQKSEMNILFLEEKNINNVKNITFETIIIMKKIEKTEVLKQILQKATYLIINSDIKENFQLLRQEDLVVITYGFNSKATITTSSAEDENLIICVQRNIEGKRENIFEAQEIEVLVEKEKVLDVLGIYAFFILYEII